VPVERTAIEGLVVVRWETHGDQRGFFRQTYQVAELSDALGQQPTLVQGNHSRSGPGTLRGFHAEPWDKLVYVVRGTAFCAIADTRPDSPTFGEVETFTLGDEPGERIRLFISEGLSNSFCSLTETDYLYDVGDYYTPGVDRRAVAWDDPDLAVDWPVTSPLLSEVDRGNPTLRERYPGHPRWRLSAGRARPED
jgi:dTDP-4-dehydrorhamnose 3,5-epimerase